MDILEEGDVQIIRSGNGISHAEELESKSEIFQIWFDPDLSKTLKKEASYDDYKSKDFKIIKTSNKLKIILGDGSPMKMDTEGILINEYEFDIGPHKLRNFKNSFHSIFITGGTIKLNQKVLRRGTFKIRRY